MSVSHSMPLYAPSRAGRRVRLAARAWPQLGFADVVCYAAVAAIVVGVCVARLDYAVVPHDSGTIGQAAERVLAGELPHHDFDDPYTGLLSLLNAAAFGVFGVSIRAARIVLVGATLVGFGAVYALCRRMLPVWVAGLLTVAAFLASVPNYLSPMPTWYNLFCTLLAAVAMLDYYDTRRLRWIALAGACTGASFLFKLVGLYFTAAAALFVIFVEQQSDERRARQAKGHWHWITIVGLWAYVAAVAALVSTRPRLPELSVFVAPSVIFASLLSWNEWRLRHHAAGARLRRLLAIGAVFFSGLTATVAVFLLPYVIVGDVASWFRGVFVSPLRRLEDPAMTLELWTPAVAEGALLLGALVAALVAARKFRRAAPWIGTALALGAMALCAAGKHPLDYAAVWGAARLVPLAASAGLAACIWLHLRRPQFERAGDQWLPQAAAALLIAASADVFSLVQFPLSHGIYFLYAAPLAVLAGAYALVTIFPTAGESARSMPGGRAPSHIRPAKHAGRRHTPLLVVGYAAFIIAFAALWLLPGLSVTFGFFYYPAQWSARISPNRGPIVCDELTAQHYGKLIEVVRKHSASGSPILALPDAPEVYFLTGRRNPTRTFFDAFDPDYGTPERDRRLLDVIERNNIDLVVVRNVVDFSREGASPALRKELGRRFPHALGIQLDGRKVPGFIVRWREPRRQPPSTAVREVVQR